MIIYEFCPSRHHRGIRQKDLHELENLCLVKVPEGFILRNEKLRISLYFV